MQAFGGCGLTGHQAESGLAVFFGPIAPPGNNRRPLADQVAIVVQPKRDHRVAFDDFGPGRIVGQRGLPVVGVEAFQGLDAGILAGRIGQFRNALAKSRMLLGHPFRLALSIDAQGVFGGIPQQVGGHPGGAFDAFGHLVTLSQFLLAITLARVGNAEWPAFGGQLDDEGNFLVFQPKGRQTAGRIGIVGFLRW
jgi:hypothetical protein